MELTKIIAEVLLFLAQVGGAVAVAFTITYIVFLFKEEIKAAKGFHNWLFAESFAIEMLLRGKRHPKPADPNPKVGKHRPETIMARRRAARLKSEREDVYFWATVSAEFKRVPTTYSLINA